MIRLIWLEEVSNFVLKSSLKWISEKTLKSFFNFFLIWKWYLQKNDSVMICFKRINLKKSFLAWKLYRSFLIKFYRSTALLLRLLELLFAITKSFGLLGNQRYWNRRFAIPGVWANTGTQRKNRFFPSSDIMRALTLVEKF